MQELSETVINFYPIAKFFIIVLAIVGGYNCLTNLMNLLGRYGKDVLVGRYGKDVLDNKKDMQAKEKDAEIINNLVARYPLVDKEFIVKPEKEQNIENNQEIHEINKKIEELEKLVKGAIEKCK